MTRTNEMTNLQVRTRHRTTAQIAELCLQSAEDYHQQQQLSDAKIFEGQAVGYSRGVQPPCRPTPTSSDQPRLASCINDRHRPACASFTPRWSPSRGTYQRGSRLLPWPILLILAALVLAALVVPWDDSAPFCQW
jgi:hypothetical protein